jgi:hypothetical protein
LLPWGVYDEQCGMDGARLMGILSHCNRGMYCAVYAFYMRRLCVKMDGSAYLT